MGMVVQTRHKDALAAVCDVASAAGAILSATGHTIIGTSLGGGQGILKALWQLSPLVHNGGYGGKMDLKKACLYDTQSGKVNLKIFIKATIGTLKLVKMVKQFSAWSPLIAQCSIFLKGLMVIAGIVEICMNRKKILGEISGIHGVMKLLFSLSNPIILSCVCAMCGPMLAVPICTAMLLVRTIWSGKNFESVATTSANLYDLVDDIMGLDPIISLPRIRKAAEIARRIAENVKFAPGTAEAVADPEKIESLQKASATFSGIAGGVVTAIVSCCQYGQIDLHAEFVDIIKITMDRAARMAALGMFVPSDHVPVTS
ncbi:MAG: hypothetical protein LBB18_04485 [Puniceicoccales bacterium]|jgi:hypothetical protein|nr:hypothetical protein [Puniceicoccales bacterium]